MRLRRAHVLLAVALVPFQLFPARCFKKSRPLVQSAVRARNYAQTVGTALVGCLAALAPGQAKKAPPAKPLDLNTATVEQLQQLPGIGPATAKAIVRFREKSGLFHRVEDLLAVRGITKRKLEKLRPYVTVRPEIKSTVNLNPA